MILEDREKDHLLLCELFDKTYQVMKKARGTAYTVGSERVIERKTILDTVEQAVKKAEREALNAWRINATKSD